MGSGDEFTPAIERRRLLKAAVAAGAGTALWASPAIQSVGTVPVSAQSGLPDGTATMTRSGNTWSALVSGEVTGVTTVGEGSPAFTIEAPAGCTIESVVGDCSLVGGLGTQTVTLSGCGSGSVVTLNVYC